jgi:hypothetical protein
VFMLAAVSAASARSTCTCTVTFHANQSSLAYTQKLSECDGEDDGEQEFVTVEP